MPAQVQRVERRAAQVGLPAGRRSGRRHTAGQSTDIREQCASEPMIVRLLSELLAPAQIKHVETQCQWTLVTLRICEAMRLYAADHDGRWPDRLSDITEVPSRPTPSTGSRFFMSGRKQGGFDLGETFLGQRTPAL